eukprot:3189425-Pyramimonas_sp.AAC.1
MSSSAAASCNSGGLLRPVMIGFPMGSRCVIMLVALYPHCALAMAMSSVGSGPPGVGTPCPVSATTLRELVHDAAAASVACSWDALASATTMVGVFCPSSCTPPLQTSSLICS